MTRIYDEYLEWCERIVDELTPEQLEALGALGMLNDRTLKDYYYDELTPTETTKELLKERI